MVRTPTPTARECATLNETIRGPLEQPPNAATEHIVSASTVQAPALVTAAWQTGYKGNYENHTRNNPDRAGAVLDGGGADRLGHRVQQQEDSRGSPLTMTATATS